MKTIGKITLTAAVICIMTFGFSSCKNREPESHAPRTAAEARELAASQIWSETPDTVFLGYYWGMSEKEVNTMTARYVKEKKFRKESYGSYHIHYYTMTLSELGEVVCNVHFNFRDDSLFGIVLSVNILETPGIVPFTKLVEKFSDILTDKGYSFFYDKNHPLFNVQTFDFFKGNTSVTLMDSRGDKSIIFLNEYVEAAILREKAAKDEEERQKAMKENEQKSNQTRNDF